MRGEHVIWAEVKGLEGDLVMRVQGNGVAGGFVKEEGKVCDVKQEMVIKVKEMAYEGKP